MARGYAPLPAAGPSRLPAAIIHPEDELPKTWSVISTWTYHGQRGAWLIRDKAGQPLRDWDDRGPGRDPYRAKLTDAVQIVYRTTAHRRRTSHIGAAIGHAHVADGYTCDPDLPWDDYEAAQRAARAVATAQRALMSAAQSVAPTSPSPAPPPSPVRRLSAPPAPGVERARWIGQQITDMVSVARPDYSPHAKRRIAARLALARVAGYEPANADNDALYVAGASVLLAGLNEYARRVLDEGERSLEDSDAVL